MDIAPFQMEDHVAVVTLNSGENRFNPAFLTALAQTLDTIESDTEATTLVVHSAHEKIFSNGIDLEYLAPLIQSNDIPAVKSFFYQLNTIFKRLVTYPLVTLAAISGHAFAGGALISCAFDIRLMRSDRGYFCLPEVDQGMAFLPGMTALLRCALSEPLLREMQLTGIRLTAEMCQAHGVIKKACPGDQLLDETLALAKQINKRRPVVAELKKRVNQAVIHAIDVEDVPHIESGQFLFG